ncbi:MAG: TRAP transporter substrate-binding protein [Clostridia bacterium]|nr:TRAP transporter substrate-binding protein [Clostridia bacterium]
MKIKNILVLLITLTMVFSLAACGGGETKDEVSSAEEVSSVEETITIKFAGTVPDDHPITQAQYKFKEELERLTDNKVVVEVYPNGQLGGGRELMEAVQLGNLDMCESSLVPLASFTEDYMAIGLPFLFPTREIAYAFADGEVGQLLSDTVAEQTGIRTIAYFENGIRQFTNSKRPVIKPEDMKGLKVRVMESPVYIQIFTALGANPTPMSFSEVYTALQQKTVDGQDNPYAITATNKFYEVQKYMTDLSHTFDFTGMLINENIYESYPDDIKAAINEAAKIAAEYQRQLSIEKEAEFKATVVNGGVELTELTAEQRAAFRETCKPVYDWFKETTNPTVSVDVILEEVDRLTKEIGAQ